MQLTLKLTDQRVNGAAYAYGRTKTEDYTRADVDLTGERRVIAGFLRTLADDLDPQPEPQFIPAQFIGGESA